EPWITCDDRLMRERAADILAGATILRELIGARELVVGIEDNKPEAHAALVRALRELRVDGIQVIQVPTRYPAGGEKQLIHVVTGK
ncbi:MAG: electron transport complex subunit RsxC, partial [Gammaproteobacteria bacterium]